jgi:dUTP pyrophosphatase
MYFEKVSRFENEDLKMPERKTALSAGYDMYVAEDIIIPPYDELFTKMLEHDIKNPVDVFADFLVGDVSTLDMEPKTLEELAAITKQLKTKPTLVSTGMKCKLDPGTYLALTVRSSCPLKHWIMLGNSVGIIDADYYNNPDNEGEIFFQVYNMSPFPIQLKKGDGIGQGIISPYFITEDDKASGKRVGGFGSTDVGHTDMSAMQPAT